jgi:Bacterial Ig-like domain (group 3)/FG-GAP-like repeat
MYSCPLPVLRIFDNAQTLQPNGAIDMFFSPTSRVPAIFPLFLISTLSLLVLLVSTQTASAQSFQSIPGTYSVGENPNSGVAGDFNGDGKLDLASANVLHKNVSVLLNNGSGTFASAVNYAVDFNPEPIITADFNGDGKLDLVTGNFFGGPTSAGTISILLGNGNGTFQPAVNYAAGTPSELAVADLNADGKLDLVAASNTTSKATVILGNGDGTFQAPVPFSTGTEPVAITIADFNGDNKPDLATANNGGFSNTSISILIGNGNGTFQTATHLDLGTRTTDIIARDLDGDTKQDLVVVGVDIDAILVLMGNGNGTFQGHVSYGTGGNEPLKCDVADFNGDGKVDVVAVNANIPSSFSVFRGVGNGTFLAADTTPSRNQSISPIAADFNGDGKPDLALTNNFFDVLDVFLNSPTVFPVNIIATQGVEVTAQLALFIDFDTSKTAGNFTASINWGDGTSTTAGTVTTNPSGGFDLKGTHTFNSPGTFNINIEIVDNDNNFARATGTATVKATTTTTVSSSVNPSDFGQSVTFTATVTASAGTPAGTVQFKDNGSNLGTAVSLNGSGVATVSTSSLTVGTHTITAEYSGATNFEASTGTLSGGQVVRPQPSLSVDDVSVAEGDSGTKTLTFTVSLSAASSLTVAANFATADASANAGSDYQAATGSLTFNPGETSKTVAVSITGDTTNEPDETFVVNISNPVNATVSDGQGVGTIVNEDAPVLLIDETTGRALALDSMIVTRDPFSLLEPNYLGTDKHRRVTLYVWRLGLLPTDTAADITVTAHDGAGGTYNLPVEFVGPLSAVDGVTHIVVRLPDTVAGAPRDLFIKVQLHGPGSNEAVIKISGP